MFSNVCPNLPGVRSFMTHELEILTCDPLKHKMDCLGKSIKMRRVNRTEHILSQIPVCIKQQIYNANTLHV